MSKVSLMYASLIIFSFLLVSCKKTVEGETKAWQRNEARIAHLSSTYPGLAALLQEDLEKGRAKMKAAENISDEKTKIEAMADANRIAIELADHVSDLENKIDNIQRLITSVNKNVSSQDYSRKQENEVNNARQLIKTAKENLNQLNTDNKQIALKVLNDEISLLSDSEGSLDAILSEAKEKKAEREKELDRKAIEDDKQSEKVAKPPVEQSLTCKYCKISNKATNNKCDGCGASLTLK